jgi:hypothetical protein
MDTLNEGKRSGGRDDTKSEREPGFGRALMSWNGSGWPVEGSTLMETF